MMLEVDNIKKENKNFFSFSCPSKTFLMGEYLALLGGPAILANTEPRFEMTFIENEEGYFTGNPFLNKEDPLYAYYEENDDFLCDFHQDYQDPYEGAGGFGSSSAQWLFFYCFINQFQEPIKKLFLKENSNYSFSDVYKKEHFSFFEKMILKYQSYIKKGFKPSGYDFISQMFGGLCYVDRNKKKIERLQWAFKNIDFFLIKNSEKIETHKHLKNLKDIPKKDLLSCVENGYFSIKERNEKKFISSVNFNYKALLGSDLISKEAKRKISRLESAPGVEAVKGCGALGHDVFFVVVERERINSFKSFLVSEKMNLVADSNALSQGVKIESQFQIQDDLILN